MPIVEMEAELRVLAWLKPSAARAPLPSTLRLTYFRHDEEEWQQENPSTPDAPPRGLVNSGLNSFTSSLAFQDSRPRLLTAQADTRFGDDGAFGQAH